MTLHPAQSQSKLTLIHSAPMKHLSRQLTPNILRLTSVSCVLSTQGMESKTSRLDTEFQASPQTYWIRIYYSCTWVLFFFFSNMSNLRSKNNIIVLLDHRWEACTLKAENIGLPSTEFYSRSCKVKQSRSSIATHELRLLHQSKAYNLLVTLLLS